MNNSKTSFTDENVIEGIGDDTEDEDSLYIFGRDVTKIPCFRNSFLYGMGGGFGCGIATFLATSRARLASHVAVGSFLLITQVVWFDCRRKWGRHNFITRQDEGTFPEDIEAALERKRKYAEEKKLD